MMGSRGVGAEELRTRGGVEEVTGGRRGSEDDFWRRVAETSEADACAAVGVGLGRVRAWRRVDGSELTISLISCPFSTSPVTPLRSSSLSPSSSSSNGVILDSGTPSSFVR